MEKAGLDSPGSSSGLLAAGDPAPVIALNEGSASPFLLIGDHAGRAVPAKLGDLGVSQTEMDRHIAWDIGVAGLGVCLSSSLNAPFIGQAYSRLVVDCNRKPGALGSIPEESDGTQISGNVGLTLAQRQARFDEIYAPYQGAIAAALDRLAPAHPVLISLHSFTPLMHGRARPWRYGVLHRGDSRFSSAVFALLQAELGEEAGDNQPYAMDGTDNTVPLHADARGLDYLELEVRQDLLKSHDEQRQVALWLAPLLARALSMCAT